MDNFKHISWLVLNGGDITLGRVGEISCVATAADEDQCLAMLVRKPNESFLELLARLDAAICDAIEHQIFTDEVNTSPSAP